MEERIVLYAAPSIGHIVSMVEVAKRLSLRRHNITILLTTGFLDHPSTDAYIHRISTDHPSISFHRFPHSDPPPPGTLSLTARALHFIRNNVPNVTSALTLISKTSTVKAFVIDIFCTSAMDAASSMGIPVYYFFTSGAAMIALYIYFPLIHEQTEKSLKDLKVELRVPGMTAGVRAWEMPEPLLDREDPCYEEMVYFCRQLPRSSGIMVNTFRELEVNAVKAIEEGLCFPDQKERPPVYYIGPLIADPSDQQHQSGGESKDCLSWLEKQPSKSVVYLCFGSRGSFSVEQLREIAQALERSAQRFLWVVKSPPLHPGTNQLLADQDNFDPISVLPTGFTHRTQDRGMVVASWAPQVEVLSRQSVGAFVTHCGWNSVLEAVVAGVPMIAWPLYAEQHVNRNVMVEDMKVALAVDQTQEHGGLVSAQEVERVVRMVMESDGKGKDLRDSISKMKDMALAALSETGSSSASLANLVQSWTQ
ncbi:hypothetical protein HN51_009734 [Arachis hypogaea]|uniref:UDP-glycosyltransferase 88F4 n=1 Tax=Arachis hypogaea TaxID=3818 RepID=UPI000DEC5D3F|nr:UDP-glycosyltransferase 88F4 [Arachis hypogaea]QHO44271.1 UDP-glycosyltransferase [Arachis hypogaea]